MTSYAKNMQYVGFGKICNHICDHTFGVIRI